MVRAASLEGAWCQHAAIPHRPSHRLPPRPPFVLTTRLLSAAWGVPHRDDVSHRSRYNAQPARSVDPERVGSPAKSLSH